MNVRTVQLTAAVFLSVLAAYGAGMWTTYKDWKPWQTVVDARELWRSWRATGLLLPDLSYQPRADALPDVFHMAHNPARAAKGYWLVNRVHPVSQTYVADLIGQDGTILHSWPIDYSKIVPGGAPTEFVHTTALLPDGTLIVNFDGGRALARLDACGKVIWAKTDQVYHHSIERAADGYWTWAEPNWIGGHNHTMVRFDPETGETLEEVRLIDDVIATSDHNATLMTVPKGLDLRREVKLKEIPDIFHPNDVEELSAELAPAFPQFKVGDLLVSFRNANLVAVLDRQTHQILWASHGPWRDQHDPDFQADGTITIFSNNANRNRSSIISVNPATGEVRDLFRAAELPFFSAAMGQLQRLPNGNWLITTSLEGRVIEVTPGGEIVREINNILNERYNSTVPYAEFFPESYLAGLPICAN